MTKLGVKESGKNSRKSLGLGQWKRNILQGSWTKAVMAFAFWLD